MDRPSGAAFEVVWGPISVEDAGEAGATQGVDSVVIRPAIAPSVVASAMECVPSEVLPACHAPMTRTVMTLAGTEQNSANSRSPSATLGTAVQ